MADCSRIEEALRSSDELARYEAFFDIYRSDKKEDRKDILSLLSGGNPLLKMLFLKYLEDIPERRAADYILTLITDGNGIIREAAQRGFLKNSYSGKKELLKPYLLSPDRSASSFAIKTLSRAGVLDILPVLLAELPRAKEPRARDILAALAFLPDPRGLRALLPFLSSADEPTRFLAFRALGALVPRGVRVPVQHFLKSIQDDSERIRRVALTVLANYPSKKIARIFLRQALNKSESPENRRRAAAAIASFPALEWIEPLVFLMIREPRSELRLAIEIVFKRFPPPLLKRGLMPLLKHPDAAIRQKSSVLLAEILGDDPEVRLTFLRLWDEAQDDDVRLELMDVLREMESPEVAPRLLQVLEKSPLLAYDAVGVLNRLWVPGSGIEMMTILENPKLPQYAKQALLSVLIKRGPEEAVKERLLRWLLDALKDPVINIRYLSLQALSWYPVDVKLEALLDLLVQEPATETIDAARLQILKGLAGNPMPLILAYQAHVQRAALTDHLVKILTSARWDEAHVFDVFCRLDVEPISLLDNHPEAFFTIAIHMMEKGQVALEKVWLFLSSDPMRFLFLGLLKLALQDDKRHFPPLPLDYLIFHLGDKEESVRCLLYELILLNRRKEGIAALTGRLLREEGALALAKGQDCLRGLVWEKETA